MPQRKKANPRPYGVPLDAVIAALPEAAKARQQGDSLVVQHPNFTTRLDIVHPPENYKSESGTIKAVIQIRSELPADIVSSALNNPEFISAMNKYATVGAVTSEDGKLFVGSRVTLWEGDEDAWIIYFPLILFALIGGTTSLFGAMHRGLAKEHDDGGKSSWTESDVEIAHAQLSQFCVCTTGGVGLTAEFGLRDGDGAQSAAITGVPTALLQVMTDQPHPELGGGLFCLLQLPHQLKDIESLDQALMQLNRMEMQPHDLVPHFGAWCRGPVESNPTLAYASFLPNALHTHGIMANLSIWAAARAKHANAMLGTLGISV